MLFLGKQIVVWGQSISFRVGDVINPNNTSWAFGFANLEQSRTPQWMVHPLLDLPEWGHLARISWKLWYCPDGRSSGDAIAQTGAICVRAPW
jgi:hypothetical protein